MDDHDAIHEVEALYLALIKRAKRWIYAESQYFASRHVAEAIAARGLRLAGWLGNTVDGQMLQHAENLATLSSLLPAPCLGRVPRLEAPINAAAVAQHLDAAALQQTLLAP